ncbi:MAG: hypothetical protein Q9190_001423 [Brigantiaea leucoxantha]
MQLGGNYLAHTRPRLENAIDLNSSVPNYCTYPVSYRRHTGPNDEVNSKIHRQFREAHQGHRTHAGLDSSRGSTGVIWTTERANEHGFQDDPSSWSNLGQGAPEAGDDIEGSFERPKQIEVSISSREYGPTAGIKSLRMAIANLYNNHHRKGKDSQYSWENVAVGSYGYAVFGQHNGILT